MPRRVLDVFLSSTAMDLAVASLGRARAADAHGPLPLRAPRGLRRPGCRRCRLLPARRRRRPISSSVSSGLRRGWEPDGDNAKRSITEMEHDWAKEAARRRYIVGCAQTTSRVPGNIRENDEQHGRQTCLPRSRHGGRERIVSQKGFGYDRPELLASEIVEHLLAQVLASDLITQLRPELGRQEASLSRRAGPCHRGGRREARQR